MRSPAKVARGLLPLALILVAAAAPAKAVESIQVVNEGPNLVCSQLAAPHESGGCLLHASGSLNLSVYYAGFYFDSLVCNVEAEFAIGGDGTLAVRAWDHYPGETRCGDPSYDIWTVCDLPWEGSGEEAATATVAFTVDACLFPSSFGDCDAPLTFELVELANETYVFELSNTAANLCRFDGELALESTSAIHVNHL